MEDSSAIMIDETYEFSAPRFYDFNNGESDEDLRNAELWFETAISYAPSPFKLRIEAARSVQLSSFCDFSNAQETTKAPESLDPNSSSITIEELSLKPEDTSSRYEQTSVPLKSDENLDTIVTNDVTNEASADKQSEEIGKDVKSIVKGADVKIELANHRGSGTWNSQDVSTPKSPALLGKGDQKTIESEKQQTTENIVSVIKNPSALKLKILSHAQSAKPAGLRSDRETIHLNSSIVTPDFVQENQAVKRPKLEDGKTRQILNIKPLNLHHKTRQGASSNLCSTTAKTSIERKVYFRDPPMPPVPFVSTAELMQKFQASTRDLSLPHKSIPQGQLQLTRPKEPEFVTAQRGRLVQPKSFAELEEEMMAKMPKFKARPLNKKILEASALPPPPKSLPRKPEFQEFHLETMERANKNSDASLVISTDSGHQKMNLKPNHLTEPKPPMLQTSLRARPIKVKSSLEIEQEELEKVPKFKARPLNKKIFESKGELGMFCHTKKQVTVPQEFHFAIDERIPPPSTDVDLFDKLSLNSESNQKKLIPTNTRPNPFHLSTEERGAEKERRFISELMHQRLVEEKARIRKANPIPHTIDFPVVPPKPDPKECTHPEPFELESLIRHENEMKREMEERLRKEREEAQTRVFKAQPVLKEDPIPLPKKERKPLTEVQRFNLLAENRAVDRAEFDKKIKEKEMMYKRHREEAETERQMEEEKALKQLRRSLVPHARPVPKFANPFMPQKSCKDPTQPKSPTLRVLRRKERKEMAGTVNKAAQSASAALMR